MSWLKRVGQFIASGVKEAAIFFPFLGPVAALIPGAAGKKIQGTLDEYGPTVQSDLYAMQSVIVNVEAMATAMGIQKGGTQKLAAAIPFFSSLLTAAESAAGHKIANPGLFNKAVAEYAQATVDLLNSREAGSSVPTP